MNNTCNILILGKTGTGKSSLINYLLNGNFEKTGVGKPITGKGIHASCAQMGHVNISAYDSQGLECGDYVLWKRELENAKEKYGWKKSASNWFHTVLYCIQASGSRNEDVDIDIINEFIKDKYNISIVYTKADICSKEDLDLLHSDLQERCPLLTTSSIFNVCSESKNICGVVHKTFGADALRKKILSGYFILLANHLPKRILHLIDCEIEQFRTETSRKISNLDIGFWSNKDNEKWLEQHCKDYLAKVNNSIAPNIIKREVKQSFAIISDFKSPIEFKGNFFKNTEDIFSSSGDLFVDIAAGITFAIIIPIAIIPIIVWSCFTTKEADRKKMNKTLDDFCKKISTAYNEQEDLLRKKLKNLLNASSIINHDI